MRKHIWLTAGSDASYVPNGVRSNTSVSSKETSRSKEVKANEKLTSSQSNEARQVKRPYDISAGPTQPESREAKRPRSLIKSKSCDKDLGVWTHEDNLRVTSAIADVTAVLQEPSASHRRKGVVPELASPSMGKKGPPSSPRKQLASPSVSKRKPPQQLAEMTASTPSTDRSQGAAAHGRSCTAKRGSAPHKASLAKAVPASTSAAPKRAAASKAAIGGKVVAATGGKVAAGGKAAAGTAKSSRGASGKVDATKKPETPKAKKADLKKKVESPKMAMKVTKANDTKKAVVKRPAMAEVMKKPAAAGATGSPLRRPASR